MLVTAAVATAAVVSSSCNRRRGRPAPLFLWLPTRHRQLRKVTHYIECAASALCPWPFQCKAVPTPQSAPVSRFLRHSIHHTQTMHKRPLGRCYRAWTPLEPRGKCFQLHMAHVTVLKLWRFLLYGKHDDCGDDEGEKRTMEMTLKGLSGGKRCVVKWTESNLGITTSNRFVWGQGDFEVNKVTFRWCQGSSEKWSAFEWEKR